MPTQLNRAVIGKEFPPYAVTVERGKIKEFARAIGDPSPFYLDDRVGAASEWGDIIAPPTFATTFRDESADTSALLRELGTDIYEKTGKSGPMAFVVRETTITDGDNDIVCVTRAITVVRL